MLSQSKLPVKIVGCIGTLLTATLMLGRVLLVRLSFVDDTLSKCKNGSAMARRNRLFKGRLKKPLWNKGNAPVLRATEAATRGNTWLDSEDLCTDMYPSTFVPFPCS